MPTADQTQSDEQAVLTSPLHFRSDLLNGQVVLVTGAGSGIGQFAAVQLARLGADVAICGRRLEPLLATKRLVESVGRKCLVQDMSIRDSDAVSALIGEVWQHFGRLDVLINNAGGQFAQSAMEFSVKGWNAVIDTNLNGPWYLMQAVGRRWKEANLPGAIVNIVTVANNGQPGIAHTCAARAGTIHLSKTLAVEWAPFHIRVNCVAPGIIETQGLDVYPEDARQEFQHANPMKRLGPMRDIADACCYLAGPTGAFITGEVLSVAGGGQLWGDTWAIPRPDYFKY